LWLWLCSRRPSWRQGISSPLLHYLHCLCSAQKTKIVYYMTEANSMVQFYCETNSVWQCTCILLHVFAPSISQGSPIHVNVFAQQIWVPQSCSHFVHASLHLLDFTFDSSQSLKL
jgi:hypothetical protein